MYEYKKVMFKLTGSNLSAQKIENSLDEMFHLIEDTAKDDWRFVQAIHPYPTNSVCLLVFERDAFIKQV